MNVITVSREFGAGGGEVARRLAERLGWELLDRELLHQAAAVEHMVDAELETLDEKALSLVDRMRLHPPHERYMHGLKEAARTAAARGNVVMVGRGTSFLVGESAEQFRLRLVAPLGWRAERMADLEGWSYEEALARCARVDQSRERFMRYFFGAGSTRAAAYDLVVNTGRVSLGEVVELVTGLLRGVPLSENEGRPYGPRILTVAREMAAGDSALIPTLAARLGLRLVDREQFAEEARLLGMSEAELRSLEEQPTARGRGNVVLRHAEVRRQLVTELAAHGDMLLVGHNGCGILQDDPRAYHVRLTAPLTCRVRRVMEHHWLKEEAARKLVADSDTARQRSYQGAFGRDWNSPLEYHVTVNAASLGTTMVDLVALAAEQHWVSLEEKTG
jgi:cytidylate kinase